MKSYKTLVLNKYYFPVAVEGVQKTFGNIFSGAVIPLDITYEEGDDARVNLENVEYFTTVPSVRDWLSLPIRPYDDYLHTARGPVRIPQVVICTNFDRVIFNRVQFPTKHNIYKRDNYTCVYTGKKLTKEQLSVDHVVPRSKGGKDTWENLVTCDRLLNSKKSNKYLSEAGLKLRYRPYKPNNGLTFDIYKDEWSSFLKNC